MPVFNVTIPDGSPLISYIGAWDDTPTADGSWQQYQNQTYHLTNDVYAQMVFGFNGSAIYLYGARKPEYGSVIIKIDSTASQEISCDASGDQFNSLLWSATDLDASKEHGLYLAHGNKMGLVDVDYLIITAGDGDQKTFSQDIFWNDDDTHIEYSGSWTVDENVAHSGGTLHLTNDINAFATITFQGNAVTLYGMTGQNHGSFIVSTDGGNPFFLNGTAPNPRYQMLTYYVNDLPNGRHTLKLSNSFVGNSPGNYTGLDTVQVSSWVDSPLSVLGSSPTTRNTQSASIGGNANPQNTANEASTHVSSSLAHHPKSPEIIAGAVVAAAVGLALCVSIAFYAYRRQHNALQRRESKLSSRPFLLPTASSPSSQHSTPIYTTPSHSTQTSAPRSGTSSKNNRRQTRHTGSSQRPRSSPGPSRRSRPREVEAVETAEVAEASDADRVMGVNDVVRAVEVIRDAMRIIEAAREGELISGGEAGGVVDTARAELTQRIASLTEAETNIHSNSPPPTYFDLPPTYREDNTSPPSSRL